MKSRTLPAIVCCAAAFSMLAPSLDAVPEIATQLDLSTDTTPAARKFYFETIPGQRYSLWRSTNMLTWEEVSGFPKVADGMSLEHTFAQQQKEFFSIEPIDEQAPTVVSQYPAVDGFAVGRFADLNLQLADATGIDPASIRLTVGASGQMASGAPGLTISGNTITYDSGDAALGAWGATVSATLVAADTLGHTLTHTWSFRLEPEPLVAANIFVFGSPTAQRSGQRVSGPAAALAARFPAPAGPVRANDPPPWLIESVLADRIVIAYEAGGMPVFAAGQLICNLAPTKESEIFYRRVVSTNNDVANSKLTVFTGEATLTDFVSQGSSTFNENSVVYEVDEIGGVISAIGDTLSLSKKTINLSGSSYKLRSDGYQATLAGIGTYSSGSAEPWLEVSLPEYQWSFQPTIKAEFEIGLFSGLTFETTISGTNSLSTVLDAKVLLTGASTTTTLYDLPPEKEPFKLIYLGQLGPVPVWAVLKFDISIKSKAEASAILEFSATYRQTHQVNALGFSKKPSSDWRFFRNVQSDSPDLRGSAALTGQFSLEIITDPRIEFLVYGLAGLKAGFEGKVGIETNASYGTGGGVLGGKLTAGVDCFVGTAGPLLDFLGIDEQLSWKWWEGEWPLTPQVLAFKTHPQSRTAAPGDDVSFTCTVDSPAPPSFQWYQNGRLLPGQTSRSLFLPFVNSGHAGTYQVKATAGNLSASSNSATLTVQATTPENLDADGDSIPNIHETNTGNWVSTTNRGTNPNKWDSDGDGLSDGVETNTGIYVSRSNTGTNPNQFDTDGDGINDKREIDLGTEPNPPLAPDGFALIPAGSFQMGDQSNPLVGYSGELPVHSVYVSAFYMGKYEVTKELWDTVRAWGLNNGYTDLPVGNGSYASKGTNHPVHSITWYDMVKWCNARSQKENLVPCYTVSGSTYKTGSSAPDCNWSASGYRLPTEAEWEKAARGGLSGKNFPWGDTISLSLANFVNTGGESYQLGMTGWHPTYAVGGYPFSSPVGSFAPNGYGLYDMAGNMSEWCWGWYESYLSTSQIDPRGRSNGSLRVMRGGSWNFNASSTRCARRLYVWPDFAYDDYGFRLARGQP